MPGMRRSFLLEGLRKKIEKALGIVLSNAPTRTNNVRQDDLPRSSVRVDELEARPTRG